MAISALEMESADSPACDSFLLGQIYPEKDFLLLFISWKFGFAKHLITMIIILLLFYSSGLLVRGTQCWPV